MFSISSNVDIVLNCCGKGSTELKDEVFNILTPTCGNKVWAMSKIIELAEISFLHRVSGLRLRDSSHIRRDVGV